MKFYYKWIVFLFGVSAILPNVLSVPGDFKYCKIYLVFLMNASILIFHVYIMININIASLEPSTLVIADIIANVIKFAHRYLLCKKFNALKSVIKFMSRFKIPEGRKFKWCLYLWAALSTMSYVLMFVVTIILNKENIRIYNLFGIADNRKGLYHLALVFYAFHGSMLMNLPINTFAIFYVAVCHHVICVLNTLSQKISNYCINFKKLMRCYNSINETMEFLDNELSLFVLFETIYTSCVLLFAISGIFHLNLFRDCLFCLNYISFLCILVNSLVLFIVMSTYACLVSETYSRVWTKVNTEIANLDTDFTLRQQKFLLCLEKELYFTVWKIVPIRRSFIVCIFGAIITYIMLFENLVFPPQN